MELPLRIRFHSHLLRLPLPLLHHHRRGGPLLSFPLPRPYHRGATLVARAEPPLPEADPGRSPGEAPVPVSSPSPSQPPPSPTKRDGKAIGFGGSAATQSSKKRKKGRGKERDSVVRRFPIERNSLVSSASKQDRSQQQQQKQQQQLAVNESAFLLTWLGLGALILVEGIALAAAGFLPEEWDDFFVKYVYPSFTPTVLLFLGGTVAYGVFKYLQAEKMKS